VWVTTGLFRIVRNRVYRAVAVMVVGLTLLVPNLVTLVSVVVVIVGCWTRESRFTYRGREHYRLDHVYLARTDDTAPRTAVRHTANERAGLIERRWWSAVALWACKDKLLPAELPDLLQALLDGCFPSAPLNLTS
jgi:hypothetical protein